MTLEPPRGDRPRWSFTWLLRLQRTGRNRVERAGDAPQVSGFARIFPWVVVLLLIIEIAIAVWLGLLPR